MAFLSAQEIATELGDARLSEAFAGADVIGGGRTQSGGGYDVTLLGVVSGDMISDLVYKDDNGTVRGDRTYVAVSITHTNGTPMPATTDSDFDPLELFVSPYIEGYNPATYNAVTMNGGFSTIVRDGVQYRILETSNIEAFADHTIYIGVSEGMFYNSGAYIFDEATGKIARNPDFPGLNALFTLDLDPAKADPKKAEQLLSEIEQSDGGGFFSDVPDEVSTWANKITPENASEYGTPDETSRETYEISSDHTVFLTAENYNEELPLDEFFPEWNAGDRAILTRSAGETLDSSDTFVSILTLNSDNTVTYVRYRPK